jgi:hypothetical protein
VLNVAFPFNNSMQIKSFQGHGSIFIILKQKNGNTEIFTVHEWLTFTSLIEMSLDMINPCKKEKF